MDHSFIEETNQVDRYVRGTMPPAERAAFEEHFLDCASCLEQLEIAKSLRESVRIAGAELASSAPVRATAEPRRAWGWNWVTVGAMAGVAALSFTSVLLYRQLQYTRGELGRTQLASVQQQAGASRTVESREPLLYALSLSRGAATSNTVEIPASPRWVVFSIQMDASQFRRYRAVLWNQAGQQVWQKENLQPSSPDMIAIPVLSTVLSPGSYRLNLEGQDSSGQYALASTFSVQANLYQPK